MESRKKKIIGFVMLMLAVVTAVLLLVAVILRHRLRNQPPAVETMVRIETAAPEMPSRPDDWRLTLVNPWNAVPDGLDITLAQLEDDQTVDERCYEDLMKMMAACEAAGKNPVICSSYRTQEKQQALYDNKVMRVMAEGYSEREAPTVAAREVAYPGTSEHQLGLAVDIVHDGNWNLDESQEKMPTQQWLMEHSWEYGFILRYPKEKSKVTGIIYEPWHYRYVGKEYAREMHDLGMCLEEYLDHLTV